jgi:hypothetical protein
VKSLNRIKFLHHSSAVAITEQSRHQYIKRNVLKILRGTPLIRHTSQRFLKVGLEALFAFQTVVCDLTALTRCQRFNAR